MLEMTASNNMPTDRRFGLVFAIIFVALAVYGQLGGWGDRVKVLWGAAMLFGVVALFVPRLLSPLNRAWFWLGLLLGRLVSPIMIGAIFFILFTPTALLARLFGHDELRLKRQAMDTYWISRAPPGPASDSFERQF